MMQPVLIASFLAAFHLIASAQMEIPGNPIVGKGKTTTRGVGGNIDPGATVEQGGAAATRYVTHIVLHESRTWTSTDGKPLEAKLIAFEDLTAEVPKGSAVPKLPAPPARPTLVRDGKIRLMTAGPKFFVIAVDRFSSEDQELIRQLQIALDRKAAAGMP
jgi:hypothetical protein